MLRAQAEAARGGWRRLLFHLTRELVIPGPSLAELRERELIARVKTPVVGCRRIAIVSRKGGVGKTTTTLMLGHTFASLRGDRVIALEGNPDAGSLAYRVRRETTNTIMTAARRRSAWPTPTPPTRRSPRSDEQRDMVRRLVGDGDAVAVVVGKAGSGKTFALDVAREAWEHSGYQVIGAALARRAAHELQDGAGIPSTSITALLQNLRGAPESVLSPRSVLVVDEAGMVGTRQIAELLDHATAAEAKVVLVGDHHQLPEIDAGGVFRGLVLRTQPIQLLENRRQRETWERDGLDLLREGHAGEAIARYREHGRVIIDDRATDVRAQLVEDWWNATEVGEDAVMLALRRPDVAELNKRARALMTVAGRLDEQTAIDVGGRTFAVGDHVVCLANAQRLGVTNGTRATITNVLRGGAAPRSAPPRRLADGLGVTSTRPAPSFSATATPSAPVRPVSNVSCDSHSLGRPGSRDAAHVSAMKMTMSTPMTRPSVAQAVVIAHVSTSRERRFARKAIMEPTAVPTAMLCKMKATSGMGVSTARKAAGSRGQAVNKRR